MHLPTAQQGGDPCPREGAAPTADLNTFLSLLASEAARGPAGGPPPRDRPQVPLRRPGLCRGSWSRLAPSKQKYFCKVLGQGGSMKYEENLNPRFLMQSIYHLYQK